jgi:hypothetical protein
MNCSGLWSYSFPVGIECQLDAPNIRSHNDDEAQIRQVCKNNLHSLYFISDIIFFFVVALAFLDLSRTDNTNRGHNLPASAVQEIRERNGEENH